MWTTRAAKSVCLVKSSRRSRLYLGTCATCCGGTTTPCPTTPSEVCAGFFFPLPPAQPDLSVGPVHWPGIGLWPLSTPSPMPGLQLPSQPWTWPLLSVCTLPSPRPPIPRLSTAAALRELSEAVLARVAGDEAAERQRAEAAHAQGGPPPPPITDTRWWNSRCRRMLRPPAQMKEVLRAVLTKYEGPAGQDTTYGTLVTEETWAVHAAVEDLIDRGCLTGEGCKHTDATGGCLSQWAPRAAAAAALGCVCGWCSVGEG